MAAAFAQNGESSTRLFAALTKQGDHSRKETRTPIYPCEKLQENAEAHVIEDWITAITGTNEAQRPAATDELKIVWATTMLCSALQTDWRQHAAVLKEDGLVSAETGGTDGASTVTPLGDAPAPGLVSNPQVDKKVPTWTDFLNWVRGQHINTHKAEFLLRKSLWALRQGDLSPIALHNQFASLQRNLHDFAKNDRRLAFDFFQRLLPSLRIELEKIDFDLGDSYTVATKAEAIWSAERRHKRTISKVDGPRRDHDQSSKRSYRGGRQQRHSPRGRRDFYNGGAQVAPISSTRRPTPDTPATGANTTSVTCYNCGKTGHVSRECPEPKKEKKDRPRYRDQRPPGRIQAFTGDAGDASDALTDEPDEDSDLSLPRTDTEDADLSGNGRE
jgi:hypothetical protein